MSNYSFEKYDLKAGSESSGAGVFSLLLLPAAALQSIYILQMLPLTSGGATCLHAAALCSCLAARPAALVAILHHRLVTHGAVSMGSIIKHAVVVGGRVCDDAHEEGSQRGVIDEGEYKGRIHREERDGAHGGYNSGGGRFHAFFTEFYGASVADSGNL